MPCSRRAGGEPATSTPQGLIKLIDEEYARFGQAIRLARLKVE